jgi:DNA gyrase/topoisomerase IV subunit B
MASGFAGEAKERLAVDAAANPNSSVTAEKAEQVILDESKKAGAVALKFDPNASPEEKAAQARAVSRILALQMPG